MSLQNKQKIKVVVIGGGNGSAIDLRALKKYADELEIGAVISTSDSGGSSGKLRRDFNTLPPGDLLRAILAMSKHDYKLLKEIFYHIRFSGSGKLDKHNLGNLFLVLAQNYDGSWLNTLRALEQSLEACGHVYPVSLDLTDLCVELGNGDIIKTEGVIDRPNYERALRIKKAWLSPSGEIFMGAKKVIEEADYIFIGPGSLYCSVIATLLPNGVKEAIATSKAKLIYVAGNAYEKNGETGPIILSEFVKELENYLPRPFDKIVFNNCAHNDIQKKYYQEKNWGVIEMDLQDERLIACDYEKEEGGLSPEKLGEVLKNIIK